LAKGVPIEVLEMTSASIQRGLRKEISDWPIKRYIKIRVFLKIKRRVQEFKTPWKEE